VVVRDDETGPEIADLDNVLDFGGAVIGRGPGFKRRQPVIDTGAVAIDGSSGTAFDLTLTADLVADAFTLLNFPEDDFVQCELRLMQDGTGGRKVDGLRT
jgi:hypothetical protein